MLASADSERWCPCVQWIVGSVQRMVGERQRGAIPLASGGFFETNRRERPKLLFGKDGTPTHLFNGAITGRGTYTVVAPLNVPANR